MQENITMILKLAEDYDVVNEELELAPEKELYIAILLRAVMDYVGITEHTSSYKSLAKRRATLKKEAEEWLYSDSIEESSCLWLMAQLGLDRSKHLHAIITYLDTNKTRQRNLLQRRVNKI